MQGTRAEMKNSVRHIIGSVLLSCLEASLCVLQAQQSGNATAEQNHRFQPQLVMKTVSVINPPARGSVTTMLKGTELAPNASGQAKLKMGDVEVTLEAQANGLPVVAGASGGVAGIVRNGETGLLVPPGDVSAFAASVRRLLVNPELRLAMGAAARANILRAHDLPVAAARLGAIIAGLDRVRAA